MKPRTRPALCVTCPDCGSTYSKGILNEEFPFDEEWYNEVCQYAREGYTIEVKEATELNFDRCKCNSNEPDTNQ